MHKVQNSVEGSNLAELEEVGAVRGEHGEARDDRQPARLERAVHRGGHDREARRGAHPGRNARGGRAQEVPVEARERAQRRRRRACRARSLTRPALGALLLLPVLLRLLLGRLLCSLLVLLPVLWRRSEVGPHCADTQFSIRHTTLHNSTRHLLFNATADEQDYKRLQ